MTSLAGPVRLNWNKYPNYVGKIWQR